VHGFVCGFDQGKEGDGVHLTSRSWMTERWRRTCATSGGERDSGRSLGRSLLATTSCSKRRNNVLFVLCGKERESEAREGQNRGKTVVSGAPHHGGGDGKELGGGLVVQRGKGAGCC
jgi:hypothetical protein